MNTTPYMDKQIMDLSQGSPATQSKGFIDSMKHPEEEEEADHSTHHTLQIAGARKDEIDKKEEILASYDFQPIRPVGVVAPPSQSPNFDATPVLAGRTWSSASDSKLNTAAAATSTRVTFLTLSQLI